MASPDREKLAASQAQVNPANPSFSHSETQGTNRGALTPAQMQASELNPTRAPSIVQPTSGINKSGFIDTSDGSNIRTGPAESGGQKVIPNPLPPATRVFVSGQHPDSPGWHYVSAYLGNSIVRGYVQGLRINTLLPEPQARLYAIQSGDTAESVAQRFYSSAVKPGQDLRFFENVLLSVNQRAGRDGVRGSFQNPGILGGGANNVQLVAGKRIWIASPNFAQSLTSNVPDGSFTNGAYAHAKSLTAHINDLIASVTGSPSHFGTVAKEYADVILQHLPEIVGVVCLFIGAEALSGFLAAAPTGVSQLAAAAIQLVLAAFGAAGLVVAGVDALKEAAQWLTLAWTAKGNAQQIAQASKSFLRMLVSVAMAALAAAGMQSNLNNAKAIASNIRILPPQLMQTAGHPGSPILVGGGGITTTGTATLADTQHGAQIMAMAGNNHGGGKNAKHANRGAREAAKEKWEAAKSALEEAKRSGATKKEKAKIQGQINHWKRKMDFAGEHHSQKAKR